MCPLDSAIGAVSALCLELAMMRRNVQRWQSVIRRNIGQSRTSPNTHLDSWHASSLSRRLTSFVPGGAKVLSSEFRWRCQVQSCARHWLQLVVEYCQFRALEPRPNWEGLHNHNKNLYHSCSTFLHSFARRSYSAGQTWITLVST